MKRRTLIALVIVFSIFLLFGGVKFCKITQQMAAAPKGPPPTGVTTVKSFEQIWDGQIHAVGSLQPVLGAVLSFEESGRVRDIGFESGQIVNKDSVLVGLDTSVEEADLAAAEAEALRTKRTFERDQTMREAKANSVADLERAEANYLAAVAQVNAIKARIQRKQVVAPFQGRAGIRLVNLGDFVNVGSPIVSLQNLETFYVNFSIPERDIMHIRVGQKVYVSIGPVSADPFEAQITALDPSVEPTTRTLRVQATLQNKGELLRAGMFADVVVTTSTQTGGVVVPLTSIQFATHGNSVFLINPLPEPVTEGQLPTVTQQAVVLGETRGDLVMLLSGVEPGQEIVSSGAFKLFPGAPVIINNSVQVPLELSPKPEDS